MTEETALQMLNELQNINSRLEALGRLSGKIALYSGGAAFLLLAVVFFLALGRRGA